MKNILLIFGCLILGCAAAPPERLVVKPTKPKMSVVKPTYEVETLNPFGDAPEVKRKPMFLPRLPMMQEVGFVYRPPRGFERENSRSHTFVNDTKYAARIFVDGTELRQVTNGMVAQTPVTWNGNMRFLPLLPPDAKLYHIGDSDQHTVIVELYAGPAPLQYAMTCKIEVNFLRQQTVHLSYRPCHKGQPSL